MEDLEATRLCAEAMGIAAHENDDGAIRFLESGIHYRKYDPLHDDAQAMALVKRFDMVIERDGPSLFGVTLFGDGGYAKGNPTFVVRKEPDINRAVVYCVAKMQAAKK